MLASIGVRGFREHFREKKIATEINNERQSICRTRQNSRSSAVVQHLLMMNHICIDRNGMLSGAVLAGSELVDSP